MIKIDLKYGFSQQWQTVNGVSVIGFAYNKDSRYLSAKELVLEFEKVNSTKQFEEILLSLNGNFGVVVNKDDITLFAVDRLRTYPLLYGKNVDTTYITDNAQSEWIKDLMPNESARNQLIDFWCVLNNETLKEGLFQLQAGEYGYIEEGEVKVKTYYRHFSQDKFENSDEVLGELDKVQEIYFDKWYEQIRNKEVWIPLSGGFDSRYLLAMLIKYGHPNLHAYTYGKADGFEANMAQKVTKQLQVDWHFVEYKESLFKTFLEGNWNSYALKNHHYTSLPHEQDYFALWQLREVIQKGSYILPGFCGDFLGGSQLVSENADLNSVYTKIEKSFSIELSKSVQDIYIQHNVNIKDAYQQWFLQQKISKFILNSVRVYEHFDYQYLLPLWDNDWTNFWYRVPYSLRENQFLYRKYLMKKVFKPLKIDFVNPEKQRLKNVKEKIKSCLPYSILERYQIQNRKMDINNLQVLYDLIYKELQNNNIPKDYHINKILSHYLLKMITLEDNQSI